MRPRSFTCDLVYIDETAALIQQSASRQGRKGLDIDDVRDATLYRLPTVAESTQRLSPELKRHYPGIPWADIAGFRNRVVHGYLGVSLDIVSDVVDRELPKLAQMAQAELALRVDRPLPERGDDLGMGH